jgi:hypothetical protein
MVPKQQCLDLGFFQLISKQESENNAKRAFATLSERIEKKEVLKRPVGRPKKEL